MTTKHTPGPWAHRNGRIYSVDREQLTIAQVARAADGDFSPANGLVIAAAPELLDLLSALECNINTLVYCYERKPDNFGRAVTVAKADAERARAAIAKAKGEQQ
ncbi:hypothetical protein [Achromobacter insolitus]|uniref:hypothetical protein n=1 Tax=Achromobacter insolitus TaxID=217204 RepID=UPI0020A2E60D|nr:hypothetical protein [Achromobacter insolitus]MCP1404456.1 hypothetical protein [Achromobacter insolitus]